MKKYLIGSGIISTLAFTPLLALAACGATGSYGQGGDLCGVVDAMASVVAKTVPLAASFALVAFFWGLAMYLFNFGEGKEDKQKQGRNLMIYGLLAIFVIVSVFGIAKLLQNTFGITNNRSDADTPYFNNTSDQSAPR